MSLFGSSILIVAREIISDDTPLSRYRLEAVSPAGRRRQLAFSVHKTRRQDVTSPHNSNTSSPGGSRGEGEGMKDVTSPHNSTLAALGGSLNRVNRWRLPNIVHSTVFVHIYKFVGLPEK